MFIKFLKKVLFPYLERTGRAKAFVDTYGKVLFIRYFFLGVEADEKDIGLGKAKARWWPNAYFHVMTESDFGPDTSTYHRHPWRNFSWIVSGGYWEFLEGKGKFLRKKGATVFRGVEQRHFIEKTLPDTITFFIHWFRKYTSWQFRPTACTSGVCQTCIDENNGVCRKSTLDLPYVDYIAKMEKLDPPRWVFYDDAGKLKLKRRRAAALRAGKKSLSQEQAEVYMQEHLLKDPENLKEIYG
jgi:hypothetical protein